jgi:hypothetical protein
VFAAVFAEESDGDGWVLGFDAFNDRNSKSIQVIFLTSVTALPLMLILRI